MQSSATAVCESNSNAMPVALSLGELISLCESKREKLLERGPWQGEMGHASLDFFVGLAGLSWPELPAGFTERVNEIYLSPEKISTVSLPDACVSAGWRSNVNVTERRSPAPTPDSCCAPSTTHGVVFIPRHTDVISIRGSSTGSI